jgi:hypothetical protein
MLDSIHYQESRHYCTTQLLPPSRPACHTSAALRSVLRHLAVRYVLLGICSLPIPTSVASYYRNVCPCASICTNYASN